jgi:undecaprenyl pyrophosphate phosphatase UppP
MPITCPGRSVTAAIDVLLGYIRRHDYSPFVMYRLAVTVFVVVVIASGWRDATF